MCVRHQVYIELSLDPETKAILAVILQIAAGDRYI